MLPQVVALSSHGHSGGDRKVVELTNLAATWLAAKGQVKDIDAVIQLSMKNANTLPESREPRLSALDLRGHAYRRLGLYEEAVSLHRRTLDVRAKRRARPSLRARSWQNLGRDYSDSGNYKGALDAYANALALHVSDRRPDELMISHAYAGTAQALLALGRYEEAHRVYQQSRSLRQRVLGGDSPYVAACWNGLGHSLSGMGRYAEARCAHLNALRIYIRSTSTDAPPVAEAWDGLGEALQGSGDSVAAIHLHGGAANIYRANYGRSHACVAYSLASRGAAFAKAGNPSAGLGDCELSLRMFSATLPSGHLWLYWALRGLTLCHAAMGDERTAWESFAAARATLQAVQGERARNALLCLERAVIALLGQGNR
jgi:tetratricopeptide (TPR) repeat protein